MKRVGRRDTKPERELRSILHRRGLRFRIDVRPLRDSRTRADIVLVRQKIAIFSTDASGTVARYIARWRQTNTAWWRAKLRRNRQRDRLTSKQLTKAGWTVLRFWEHEPATECADTISAALLKRRNRV